MQNVMQALYLTRNARGLPASVRCYKYIGIEIDEQYSKLAATRAAEHHQKGETT
jgi:hypothetical protein